MSPLRAGRAEEGIELLGVGKPCGRGRDQVGPCPRTSVRPPNGSAQPRAGSSHVVPREASVDYAFITAGSFASFPGRLLWTVNS